MQTVTAAQPATPASANLTINARILPVLKVTNPVYPEQFAVTQPDVERGYVDVEGQSSVQVVTNQTGGIQLSAEVQDSAVAAAVQLRAATGQAAYQIAAATVHVPLIIREHQVIRVAYRLILAATAQPGQYRWPVALSFSH
jgi:hypothetical protein